MIDMKSKAVQEFLSYTKMCMMKKDTRKNGINSPEDEEFIRDNRLIKILCEDMYLSPDHCAEIMQDKYGYDLTGPDILDIFKSFHISRDKRNELLKWAEELGNVFMKTLETGKGADYEAFFAKRKENICYKNNERRMIQDRFACMKLCVLLPELGKTQQGDVAESFGYTRCKYYLFDITDALGKYCGTDKDKAPSSEKKKSDKGDGIEKDREQADKGKIMQLERSLERSEMMLRDLQDEFDERLKESKVKESADFFSRLNSEKYGCILDELLNVRKGVSLLKKQHYELPPEISGLLIMTQKLTQFVRDSGINPIMKPQEIKKVKAGDIDFCDYEGTPFTSSNEEKTVMVVSPGWIYSEKDVQIARPKVKEVKDGKEQS